MIKTIYDIKIQVNGIEEIDADIIEEFLADKKYNYNITITNERIEDTRNEYDKQFDYEMQKGFDRARGED